MKFACILLAAVIRNGDAVVSSTGDFDGDELNIPLPKSHLMMALFGKNTEQIKSGKLRQQKNFTRKLKRPIRTKQLNRQNKVKIRINKWNRNRLNRSGLR